MDYVLRPNSAKNNLILNLWKFCHQDCSVGCSLCSPSQEQLTTSTLAQDTTNRILEHRGETGSPSCTTLECIRRLRGAITCWAYFSCPRLLSLHWGISSETMFFVLFFSSDKREPRVDIQLSQNCESLLGSSYSGLAPQGLQRKLLGFTSQNQIVIQKIKGDCKSLDLDICRSNSYMQLPRSNCTQQICSSAEKRWWQIMTWEPSREQVCLIWFLKLRVLSTLVHGLPPQRQGRWVTGWPTTDCTSQFLPPENLARTSESSTAQQHWTESTAGRADYLQSKASGTIQPGDLGHLSAWVKTTKSFVDYGGGSSSPPVQINEFIALWMTEDNLQSAWPGTWTEHVESCIVH